MRLFLVFISLALLASVLGLQAQYREERDGRPVPAGVEWTAVDKTWTPAEWDSAAVTAPDEQDRLLYLGGAAMGLALFDYVGYNLARASGDHGSLVVYRVLQGLAQLAVSWMLYEKLGLPSAIGFNVLWWTWGLDAIFYGYTELFNVGGSWSGRGAFASDILGNNCYWASWTPVGLAQGADPSKKIAGDTIIAQSIIGAILAVTLTVHF
ncbi:MAG: hypothetical protein KFF77_10025 [Bacteroidetes bacterium]|nr:hypothetical protein [Bacteroidota bacterium]